MENSFIEFKSESYVGGKILINTANIDCVAMYDENSTQLFLNNTKLKDIIVVDEPYNEVVKKIYNC